MTISRLPLTNPITSRSASVSKDSRSVNGYFESSGGSKYFVKRPGILPFGPTLPTGTGRGLYTWENSIITGTDNTLFEVIGETSYNVLGGLSGRSPLSFAEVAANTYLAIHDGASLYYIDKATHTFTAPSGAVSSVSIDEPGGYYGYITDCTVTFGATTTITKTGHGLVDGQGIAFTATTMPAGLSASTPYQVRYVDANTFTVNTVTTGGGIGSAVVTTTNGTDVKYSAAPVVTFSTGTVTAQGTATLYNHQVSGVIITAAGTYTTIPTVTFGEPTAGTAGSISLSTGFINNVVSGYATLNSSGQIATAVITSTTAGAAIVNSVVATGSGYLIAPTWTFSTTLGTAVYTLPVPSSTTATGTVVMASGGLTGPFAYGMEYLDGYVFVATTAGRIYQSNLDDPTTWGALNYIEVNSDPDSVVALARQLNYLVAFGQYSTEVFYNAGNPTGSVLSNNKSGKLEIGCAVGTSVAKAEHTLLWVGQGKTKGRSVYLMEGLHPIKVSNKYAERYLNESTLDTCRAMCIKVSGHTLYLLTLHDLDITLVYDLDEKEWYEWSSYEGSLEGYFKYVFFNANISYAPALYFQHDDNGQLYVMQEDFYSDTERIGTPSGYGAEKNITFTLNTPAIFVVTDHQYEVNTPIQLNGNTTPPSPLVLGTTYYVHTVLSVNSFTITDTLGGTELTTDPYVSGVFTFKEVLYTYTTSPVSIYYRSVSSREDSGTTKRKFYPRVEVVGDKVSATASIRHTDDDYQSWSTYRTVNLANKRPVLYQNGESRRRAWEILVTDNVPVRLEALEIDFDVGEIGPA